MRKLFTLFCSLVFFSFTYGQYCTPAYQSGGADDYIDAVRVGSMNHVSGYNGSSYNDFTNQSASLEIGRTYTVDVSINPDWTETVAVWVDFNQNGSFESNEMIGEQRVVASAQGGSSIGTFSFNVPTNTGVGTSRMRVVAASNTTSLTPCSQSYTRGETEDYGLDFRMGGGGDAGVIALTSPSSGCGLSASESVTIDVVNYGTDTLFSLPVAYDINGGGAIMDTITSAIPGGDTLSFTFMMSADLSAGGTYNITTYTSLGTDTVASNDTLMAMVMNTAVTTFPYMEDFEGGFPASWANDPGNPGQNWLIDAGGTPSFGTGPDIDHTLGTAIGNYLYLEDSGFDNDSVGVWTPCFDLTGLNSPQMSFWVHSNEANGGGTASDNELDIDILYNGVWTLNAYPTISHIGAAWTEIIVDLSSYPGPTVVRFRGNNNNANFTHDIAIDDVQVRELLNADIGVSNIAGPVSGCGLGMEDVVIDVTNFGSDTLMSDFFVSYSINGGATVTDTVIGQVIAPGGIYMHTFSVQGDFSATGDYDILSWSDLAGDAATGNDTSMISISNIPVIASFPYFEDFENGNGGWNDVSLGGANSWELATPANATINSAGSGSNSWVTDAVNFYPSNENSAVVGPCFDLSGLTAPLFDMKVWWNSEFSWDGAVLQSSIDGGATWQNVGAFGDPDNWFNDNTIAGNPGGQQEGWSGRASTNNGSGGWVVAEHALTGLGGQSAVLLRVAFGSDGVIEDDGFAFDDVHIYETPTTDMATNQLLTPTDGCGSPTETVTIEVENSGLDTIFGFDATYVLNGGTPVTETFPDTLVPGAVLNVAFGTQANLAAGGTYTFVVYGSAAGDQNGINDTITVDVLNSTITSFPHIEDFEHNGALPPGWIQDQNDDNQDWTIDAGGTPSFNTGPDVDHTTGTANGFYAYVEDSGFENDTVNLITPCFNIDALGAPQLSFWYHSNEANGGGTIADVNELHVDVFFNGQWANDIITPIEHAGPQWLQIVTNLGIYQGFGSIFFRFRVNNNNGTFTHDIAIDDVVISDLIPQDAGLLTELSPESGCGLSDSSIVSFEYMNAGSDTIFNIDFNYTINGGTPVTETTTVGLAPGDTATYTFITPADLSVTGTYTFNIYSTLTGDSNLGNDTLSFDVEHRTPIAIYPYTQDFENAGNIPADWVNEPNDDGQDWLFINTATPSFGTGPAGDHTTGNGYYAYMEDTGFDNEDVSLITPCFDLSVITSPQFSFWYHSNDQAGGATPAAENELHIDIFHQGAWQLDIIPPIVHKDDFWAEQIINLSAYSGSTVAIRFRGNNSNLGGSNHDIAIDDILLKDLIPQDAGVISIQAPNDGCGLGSSETVVVEIFNFGSDTIFGFEASYWADGTFIVTDTVTGVSLLPGTSTIHIFSVPADLSVPGLHTITSYTNLLGDTDATNDTTTATVEHIPVVTGFPYLEDFENGNGGWGVTDIEGVSTWELALPSNPTIDTAASGLNSWITNATGNYNNNDDSFVMGPCFDFSGLVLPLVEMSVWWESEFSWDGAVLQSSIDAGATWQNVGAFGDPDNWYNDNTITGAPGGSQEGWSGRGTTGSGGWVIARNSLTGLGGQPAVLLRVAFGSDGSVQGEGFAFDDIHIFDSPANDAGAVALLTPAAGCGLDTAEIITMAVANFGTDTITSLDITYILDGGTPVNETATVTIAPGDTVPVPFVTPGDFSALGPHTVTLYTTLAGDGFAANDTTSAVVENRTVISSYPYTEDFENGGAFPTDWVNDPDDDGQDWELDQGGTPSTGTGPAVDHTLGTAAGYYMYVEDSFPFDNDNVSLLTPCFDLSGVANPEFSFWYHSNESGGGVNTADVNELHLDILFNGAWVNDIIPPITHVNNQWNEAIADLTPYAGGNVALRFRVNNNNGTFTHDIAIDDIGLRNLIPDDVGVTAILDPGDTQCSDTAQAVTVVIENFGTDNQVNIPIQVTLVGGVGGTLSTTYTDTLASGMSDTILVGTINTSAGGIDTVTATTQLGIDGEPNNDAIFIISEFIALPATPMIQSDSSCTPTDSLMLVASGSIGSYFWYDSLGNQVHVGDTFFAPFVNTTTAYYVEASDQVPGRVGPLDNTIGGGGNYTFFGDGVVFDVLTDIILDSVTVYPFDTGWVVINLVDPAGTTIATDSTYYSGAQPDLDIFLGFEIPAGVGYTLNALGTTTGGLFRNNAGAVYPYEIPNVVSLTGAINGLAAFYYFFYDWHIRTFGCPSQLAEALAIISAPPNVDLGPDGVSCAGYLIDGTTTNAATYLWSTGDTTATLTADTSGIYWLEVVNTDGCVGRDSISLTLFPSPSVDLGPDATECGGLMLDAGNPGDSYLWSTGETTQTIDVTTTGTYGVTVTNSFGCSFTDSVNVTINALPTVALGADIADCDMTTLDAGNPGASYLWSTGESSQTIDILVSGTYYVTVTDTFGCVSSDTIDVTISASPDVSLGADVVECGSATLDAGNPTLAFLWSTGETTQTIDVSVSGTYFVTVTDPQSGCTDMDTVSVTINDAPNVNLGGDQTVCDDVTLDAGNPGSTYLWSDGSTSQTLTVTASGQYSVVVTDANGCTDSSSAEITVNESANADFTFSYVGTTDVQFTNASTGTAPLTYSWDFGDGNTSTAQNPLHTYSANGTYVATLTVTNVCGSSTTTVELVNVSVEDDLFETMIDVYPNPNQGQFVVKGTSVNSEELSISVYNLHGQIVYERDLSQVRNGFEHNVDISQYTKGAYFVKVVSDGKVAYKKIIVE